MTRKTNADLERENIELRTRLEAIEQKLSINQNQNQDKDIIDEMVLLDLVSWTNHELNLFCKGMNRYIRFLHGYGEIQQATFEELSRYIQSPGGRKFFTEGLFSILGNNGTRFCKKFNLKQDKCLSLENIQRLLSDRTLSDDAALSLFDQMSETQKQHILNEIIEIIANNPQSFTTNFIRQLSKKTEVDITDKVRSLIAHIKMTNERKAEMDRLMLEAKAEIEERIGREQ
jgi:hypothetical protein